MLSPSKHEVRIGDRSSPFDKLRVRILVFLNFPLPNEGGGWGRG
jgi:hypothetical protein